MANKLWEFIQKLAAKSDTGNVSWERTAEDGIYQVSFPNFTVRTFYRGGGGDPDYIVQILNEDGSIVEETSDAQLTQMADTSIVGAFSLMRKLYEAARRKAMGVDNALDALLEALDEDPEDPDVPF